MDQKDSIYMHYCVKQHTELNLSGPLKNKTKTDVSVQPSSSLPLDPPFAPFPVYSILTGGQNHANQKG